MPTKRPARWPLAHGRAGSRRQRGLLVLCCLALCLAGCSPRMLPSTHGYVLVRTQEGALVALSDDDPLYESFEQQVLEDAFLRRLLDVFEHTTVAYVATDTPTRLRQTVGNHPILVLDSAAPGVLADVELRSGEERVRVERALGLGRDGALDLVQAREDFAAASAPWLLALVGVEADDAAQASLDAPGTSEGALVAGLAAALDALHLAATNAAPLDVGALPEERASRCLAVQSNAYDYRPVAGQPTGQRLTREESLRTPGVVATFLYRLLERTGAYTPQRYMLWFLSYTGPEMPLAKLLRVCQRLARSGDISAENLATLYAETYPAEREAVLALYDEVFGAAPATAD